MRIVFAAAMVVVLVIGLGAGQASGADDTSADEARKKAATEVTKGQCHCGYVKYQVQGPVLSHNYCSCRGCQKATGTLKVPFAVVAKASFAVTAGKPSSYRSDSGVKCDAQGVWNFCPKCGTQVFWVGDRGDTVDIFAGTLNNTALFQPEG